MRKKKRTQKTLGDSISKAIHALVQTTAQKKKASAKQSKILDNGGVSADDLRKLKVGLGALLANDDDEDTDGSNEQFDDLNLHTC